MKNTCYTVYRPSENSDPLALQLITTSIILQHLRKYITFTTATMSTNLLSSSYMSINTVHSTISIHMRYLVLMVKYMVVHSNLHSHSHSTFCCLMSYLLSATFPNLSQQLLYPFHTIVKLALITIFSGILQYAIG